MSKMSNTIGVVDANQRCIIKTFMSHTSRIACTNGSTVCSPNSFMTSLNDTAVLFGKMSVSPPVSASKSVYGIVEAPSGAYCQDTFIEVKLKGCKP